MVQRFERDGGKEGRRGKKTALQPGKTDWVRKGQEAASLFLIFVGMCLCLEWVFNIPVPWSFRLLAGAGLALWTGFWGMGRWRLLTGMAVSAGLLAWVWGSCQESLLPGMKEAANRMLELVNRYHGTDYLYWYLDSPQETGWMALLLVCLLLGFLEGLLLLCKKGQRLWVTVPVPVLVITAGLVVGQGPSLPGLFLILAGILMDLLDLRQRGTALLAVCILSCMGFAVLLAGNGAVWNQVEALHGTWIRRQLDWENQMISAVQSISRFSLFPAKEQSEYILSNEKPVHTGKKVFEITVDSPISQKLYIRGFVGGDYEGGTWSRVSRQEFSDWAQSQGGTEEGYARIIQSFPYRFLEAGPKLYHSSIGRNRKVSLKLFEEAGGYTLLPYFTQVPDEQPLKADGAAPPVKEKQFRWNTYLNLQDVEINAATTADAFFTDPGKLSDDTVWKSYEDYAARTFTRLPEEGLEELRVFHEEQQKLQEKELEEQISAINLKLTVTGQSGWGNKEMGQILTEEEWKLIGSGYDERLREIHIVQQMLWEGNQYSFDLAQVPDGQDAAEYFLLKQHKGYCTHFATAATLLFRMSGIPARYVSGYLVLPSDFKKNKDGTWTAVVTDERAHAWTEIFGRNIGFYPLETTPLSYTEMLESMGEDESLAHAVAREEHENSPGPAGTGGQKSLENEAKEAQETENKQENKEDASTAEGKPYGTGVAKGDGARLLWEKALWMGACLAAGVCLCLLAAFFRKRAAKKRWEKLSQENRARAVREMGKEMRRMLSSMGYQRKKGMGDREYQRLLEQGLADIDWEQVFHIFQKAVFAEHGVEEAEYQWILSLYRGLGRRLAHAGGVKGWFYRTIVIYS